MHELSVALRIVEVLEQELAPRVEKQAGYTGFQVKEVSVKIGTLSGVVPEALEFAWDMATHETLLENSRLDIQIEQTRGYCPSCGEEKTLTTLTSMRCPDCLTAITQITGGSEMEILTVEVVDG